MRQRFASDLVRDGAATRHRAIVLRSAMQRAVEWGRIPANPVRSVRKPPQRREREVRPRLLASVEALRQQTDRATRRSSRPGLRRAAAGRGAATAVERLSATARVRFHATKTRTRRVRAARLMAPVRSDLVAWRLPSAPQTDDALVFLARIGDGAATDDWNNWRNWVFRPALPPSALPTTIRPTTYGTRRPACGCTRAAASSRWPEWLGHAPSMSLDTYGHVLVDLSDTERRSAEDEIRARPRRVRHPRYLEATGT